MIGVIIVCLIIIAMLWSDLEESKQHIEKQRQQLIEKDFIINLKQQQIDRLYEQSSHEYTKRV